MTYFSTENILLYHIYAVGTYLHGVFLIIMLTMRIPKVTCREKQGEYVIVRGLRVFMNLNALFQSIRKGGP